METFIKHIHALVASHIVEQRFDECEVSGTGCGDAGGDSCN